MNNETVSLKDRQNALAFAYQILSDKRNMNKYSMSQIRDMNTMETFDFFDMLRVLRVMHVEVVEAQKEVAMKTPEEIRKGLDCCIDGNCDYCTYNGLKMDCSDAMKSDALAYIQQLEAQVPKWISVEERLPEHGRYLVVTLKVDGRTKVHTATYNNMGWLTYAGFGDITHWMPLPKSPKEER